MILYSEVTEIPKKHPLPSTAFYCLPLPSAHFLGGVHFFLDFEKILNFPQGFITELSCKIGPEV